MKTVTPEELIDSIYDAVVDDAALATLPKRIAALVRGDTCTIQSMSNAGQCDLLAFDHIGPEHLQEYLEHFAADDPWTMAALQHAPNSAVSLERYIPFDKFRRTRIYNDFVLPNNLDIKHCMGVVLPYTGGLASVGIHRGHAHEPFEEKDEELLQSCTVHLRRLMLMRRRLADAERRAGAAYALFDRLALGVMHVSAEGRVIYANDAAAALLRAQDGMSYGPRRSLQAARHSDTPALKAALARVSTTSSSAALLLHRKEQKQALQLILAPFRAPGTPTGGGAMVLIHDPATRSPELTSTLMEMFGLSAREAAVAIALTEGRTVPEIAQLHRVSASTVQTQLKHALGKTGKRKQAELVALVSGTPALQPPGKPSAKGEKD